MLQSLFYLTIVVHVSVIIITHLEKKKNIYIYIYIYLKKIVKYTINPNNNHYRLYIYIPTLLFNNTTGLSHVKMIPKNVTVGGTSYCCSHGCVVLYKWVLVNP